MSLGQARNTIRLGYHNEQRGLLAVRLHRGSLRTFHQRNFGGRALVELVPELPIEAASAAAESRGMAVKVALPLPQPRQQFKQRLVDVVADLARLLLL